MTLGFAPETIEHWPLARLRPYGQNAKTHGPDQVARIAASIAEFGWTVPVLVADDGEAKTRACRGTPCFPQWTHAPNA